MNIPVMDQSQKLSFTASARATPAANAGADGEGRTVGSIPATGANMYCAAGFNIENEWGPCRRCGATMDEACKYARRA